jgi:hypothetical protein
MSGGASQHHTTHRSMPSRAPNSGALDAQQEEDVRTKQALLTAIVVLILFGAGFWLVQEFHKSITAHQCLEQGRRNCAAAEIRAR